MNQVSKAALKKFLHQHVDDLVNHFGDHLLVPEAILELALSNRCAKKDDEDIIVIEEIRSRIIPFNDPTDTFQLGEVEFNRIVEKGVKNIEYHTTIIMRGELL